MVGRWSLITEAHTTSIHTTTLIYLSHPTKKKQLKVFVKVTRLKLHYLGTTITKTILLNASALWSKCDQIHELRLPTNARNSSKVTRYLGVPTTIYLSQYHIQLQRLTEQ